MLTPSADAMQDVQNIDQDEGYEVTKVIEKMNVLVQH